MKSYPSIKRYRADRYLNFEGDTFAKLDGSNLRFEWNKKQGWFRFGSRRRLLETTHPIFGMAMEMFQSQLAETFEQLAARKNWSSIMVFCEFWGEKSFAGEHQSEDPKFLTPIDVAIYKKGLMPSSEFVKELNDQVDLHYLGHLIWNEALVEAVENSSLPGMAFEGIIGKNGAGHSRNAIKLKSKSWIEKVLSQYLSLIHI